MKQQITEENIMKSNIDKKLPVLYDAIEAELMFGTWDL